MRVNDEELIAVAFRCTCSERPIMYHITKRGGDNLTVKWGEYEIGWLHEHLAERHAQVPS